MATARDKQSPLLLCYLQSQDGWAGASAMRASERESLRALATPSP